MHYLSLNVWMTVIYNKVNSHCQICHFRVVGYLRKTLLKMKTIKHQLMPVSLSITRDTNHTNEQMAAVFQRPLDVATVS